MTLEYRGQSRIIADVLAAVRDLDDGDGVGITAVIRKSNLSSARIKPLIGTLLGSGLLEERKDSDEHARYLISQDGVTFLRGWSRFEAFARSFGLKI